MARSSRSGHGLGGALALVLVFGVVALAGLEQLGGPSQESNDKTLLAGDLYIPAAAHVAGAAGTNWRTDLEVHNWGTTQASYGVDLLRENSDNSSPQNITRSLAPGQSERLTDVLFNQFSLDGSAALRVRPGSASLVATSRTFNQVTLGTYGQFIGGILEGNAIPSGAQGRLIQLTHNRSSGSGYRTNVGFLNATGMSIGVRADFYLANGSLLGTRNYSLQPYMYNQRNRVFEDVTGSDVNDGYVVLQSTTSGGSFFAYASVVDNRTGDPIYVPAEVVTGAVAPTPTATAQGATPTRTPTRTPTVTPTQGTLGPNLLPFTPQDWSGALVVSGAPGGHTTGGLVGNATTYVDWAMANDGTTTAVFAEGDDIVTVQVDGTDVVTWVGPATGFTLDPGFYTWVDDYALTGVSPGEHTVTMVCDPANLIAEGNEGDNTQSLTATWSGKAAGGAPKARRVPLDPAWLKTAPIPGGSTDRRSESGVGNLRAWTSKALTTETVYVPASAHVAGVAGTNWRTDLELQNPGTQTAQYEVALLRENQGNLSPVTRTYTVSPGQCLRLEDVLFSEFGVDGSAALRIRPLQGSVVVTSRTYNLTSAGTYGQFIPGVPESWSIAPSQQARLIQLTHNRASGSGYRTNVGFVNASGSDITVVVALYTSGGTFLGSRSYPLQPYMFRQAGRIFEDVTGSDVSDGYAVLSANGPFFAYASVVDNATGDPIYVPAVVATGGGPGPTPTPTRTPTRTPTPQVGITVTVSPAQVTLNPGASQQFTATVTGTANTAVTWSVQEGAAGGTITAAGLYTAPTTLGTYHVRATSQADPSRFGTATVEVQELPTGVVFGRVFDTGGETLAGVTVTVAGHTAQTNEQGYYSIAQVPAAPSAVVNFVGSGYVQATELVEVRTDQSTFLDASMAPVETEVTFSGSQGGQVTTPDGGGLGVFGGSLVDPQGQPFTGTVVGQVTTFDPSVPGELAAFPGEFEGITHGGETVPFVCFGFIDVTVMAQATGDLLQLAPGQTAHVTVPIPADSLAGAPASLPQWYFNPTDGRWHEEGVFTRNGDVYEGDITHFSIWNCDVSGNRCFITGRVVDPSGMPVECARVEIMSQRNSGGWVSSGESCTDVDGRFRIPVEADSMMTYQASKGTVESPVYGPEPTCDYYQERDVGDIILGSGVGVATITLTWGENPDDLDSHLGVPALDGSCYHATWYNAVDNLQEGVILDTDDTDSYGPEIFTIYSPIHEGTYRYSVHHWGGSGTITSSPAQVTLVIDGVGLWSFDPPPGGAQGDDDVWRVFDLVNVGGSITVHEIGDYLHGIASGDDASFCP